MRGFAGIQTSKGALVPLHPQQECSVLGPNEPGFPLRLDLLSVLGLASSSQLQYIDLPQSQIFIQRQITQSSSPLPSSSSTSLSPVMTVALSPRLEQAGSKSASAQLRMPWLGRLAVEARLQQLAMEVQERISIRLGVLQEELKRRTKEVQEAKRESDRLEKEKQEVEERAAELSRQVDVSVEMLAGLRKELMQREEALSLKHQELCQLDRFVRDTALREFSAKARLQSFIEDLLERAERAEQQLQNLHTHASSQNTRTHTPLISPNGSTAGSKASAYQRSYSVSGMSRHLYQQSDHHVYPHSRMRTLSVGSMGCEGDYEGLTAPLEAQYYHVLCGAGRRYPERAPESPRWGLQTLVSTEGESDSWSLYTAESLQEEWRQEHIHSPALYRTYSKTDDSVIHCPSCRQGNGHHYPRAGESVMCVEHLRMRAGLFCVFSYLDTRALLTAAEVCRDWRSVARHPAVWTRVTLENARISSKFLVTLSQWCSQTHTLVLQNLKPRARGKKESKDDYLKNTRGCLEEGLEAVLKSAGQNLTYLSVSHCPYVLTDRALWLVSCYCRALHTLTYRSSSDPVGQEVIWALGAGCRVISSLYIAPLQPCQQPGRFSNRCLQTIGRCWPNLRQVGVGGAGCGIQGLTSLVRNCVCLCVLELDHMSEMGQEGAAQLCREGLQQLHTLIFTSTPVTPKAILHFNSVCVNLRCIVVQISIADYFEDSESDEAKKLFEEKVNDLQALRKRPGLSEVLHLRVDGLC
ncbi:F-box only protein 41 [Chanos chanos]|uniref:F-box only protein 41 n=1 Tax=Chanos chanos TaxID=29144 RepID=A0A6J2VHN1_CHACN|nr:F-box only protein 41-like [Chanos chanos]